MGPMEIDEMSEESTESTGMVNQEQTPAESVGSGPNAADSLAKELEETRKALSKANKEAANRRKQLELFERKEQERQEAEMSEMEKLQKRLAETESELTGLRLESIKRKVARDVGLPDVLALRLQGDTEDELREDAEALLKTIPSKPTAPTLQPTNPGGNAKPEAETMAQRRKRIFRQGQDLYDPAAAAKRGGGVVFHDNK